MFPGGAEDRLVLVVYAFSLTGMLARGGVVSEGGRDVKMAKKSYFALAWLAIVLISTPAASATELEVGKPFPNLVLPSLDDGSASSVSDFRGQKLILHIWASW